MATNPTTLTELLTVATAHTRSTGEPQPAAVQHLVVDHAQRVGDAQLLFLLAGTPTLAPGLRERLFGLLPQHPVLATALVRHATAAELDTLVDLRDDDLCKAIAWNPVTSAATRSRLIAGAGPVLLNSMAQAAIKLGTYTDTDIKALLVAGSRTSGADIRPLVDHAGPVVADLLEHPDITGPAALALTRRWTLEARTITAVLDRLLSAGKDWLARELNGAMLLASALSDQPLLSEAQLSALVEHFGAVGPRGARLGNAGAGPASPARLAQAATTTDDKVLRHLLGFRDDPALIEALAANTCLEVDHLRRWVHDSPGVADVAIARGRRADILEVAAAAVLAAKPDLARELLDAIPDPGASAELVTRLASSATGNLPRPLFASPLGSTEILLACPWNRLPLTVDSPALPLLMQTLADHAGHGALPVLDALIGTHFAGTVGQLLATAQDVLAERPAPGR